MAPKRCIPALYRRCRAPIHSSRSGLTGFLTSTGMSAPASESASAISCIANGLAVVRAPIHSISSPASRAWRTCSRLATSVATAIPVVWRTSLSHWRPSAPMPSKPPGRVRGFQMPARNMRTPWAARRRAVSSTCCRVSALHGPAMMTGPGPVVPSIPKGCISFILAVLAVG